MCRLLVQEIHHTRVGVVQLGQAVLGEGCVVGIGPFMLKDLARPTIVSSGEGPVAGEDAQPGRVTGQQRVDG